MFVRPVGITLLAVANFLFAAAQLLLAWQFLSRLSSNDTGPEMLGALALAALPAAIAVFLVLAAIGYLRGSARARTWTNLAAGLSLLLSVALLRRPVLLLTAVGWWGATLALVHTRYRAWLAG